MAKERRRQPNMHEESRCFFLSLNQTPLPLPLPIRETHKRRKYKFYYPTLSTSKYCVCNRVDVVAALRCVRAREHVCVHWPPSHAYEKRA